MGNNAVHLRVSLIYIVSFSVKPGIFLQLPPQKLGVKIVISISELLKSPTQFQVFNSIFYYNRVCMS